MPGSDKVFTEDFFYSFVYSPLVCFRRCFALEQMSDINRFFVDGKQIKTRETAARIVLEDDIFRAMTRQVQYMAIHCTLK